MTTEAVIDRFAVTWLAGADVDSTDRRRLDGLVAAVLDGPLEDALDELGLPRSAEICIRRLTIPRQQLRLSGGDREFLESWSRAIGAALLAALGGSAVSGAGAGDGDASTDADGVVVYRSRAHALSDLVSRVVIGDVSRAWAWRQLGLWREGAATRAGGATDSVASALLAHPTLIPGAVAAVAAQGRLGALVSVLGDDLPAVAAAGWAAVGGTAVSFVEDAPAPAPELPTEPVPPAVTGSVFFSAAAPVGARIGRPGRRALAVLAVAIAEPAIAPHPWALAVVDAVTRHFEGARRTAPATGGPATGPGAPPAGGPVPAAGPVTAAGAGPPSQGGDPVDHRASTGGREPTTPGSGPSADVIDDPATTAMPTDAGGATGWGGLLFLLHLIEDLGWPEDLAGGLRCALHRVGIDLLARAAPDAPPPALDDPAALAFCGLRPGDDPPAPAPPPTAVTQLGDRLVEALRARLGATSLASAPEPSLLLSVCRRRARVVADPGWTDVMLDLDEVSVDLRVAGLDLDPGYLPWLGCVVRFVYG